MVGQTLSHYRIVEKIGEGGMGEVYRAEDTSLKREVAIKVLPDRFTEDPQRLARFEREAQLLASLNHPNIASIHELEEADGVRFLSLELVEGETLAERVAKGPLPVEEALEVCRQIAEGVEAAHEKGVIHRDLKPANVKITPEGKVKVLDFGLAKAFEEETAAADISQSPTLTEEMTKAGVILGTAAYMSPEQAKGKPVDKRADIFAFGAVLYELLTGKRAFEGETITETIAAVLKSEPTWDALPGNTPWRIKELLEDCLQKDPHDRPHDISHARIQINKALKEPATVAPTGMTSAAQPARWRMTIPWSIAFVIAVIAAVGFWILTRPTPRPRTELVIAIPPTTGLMSLPGRDLAISPDGRHVVYLAASEGTRQLYLHSLDALIATPIAGTEGAFANFFFSPDGESVAFFATGQLKKVSLTGGTATTLCDAPAPFGGSWGSEGMIVFGARSASGLGLLRVSAAGGTPENLADPDPDQGEFAYARPRFLPGGKAVLFTVVRGMSQFQSAFLLLETGERKILIEGGRDAYYSPTGHLVYEAAGGTLMAVAFDLARLEVTGESVPLRQGVRRTPFGSVDYTFSANGTLAYVSVGQDSERTLVWVDREGTERLVTEEKRQFLVPRVSPDGKRLAVAIPGNGGRDVWIYDIERDSFSRLTFEGQGFGTLSWTPDSKWITFGYVVDNPAGNLYRKLADGSGPTERLTTSTFQQNPDSWSPDGSVLVFRENRPGTGRDIWSLPMEGDRKPELLISSPQRDCCARFSPDGKWLAYVSNETGLHHVYVSPYPEANVKWLVSGEAGGGGPLWSPDGTELFYRSGDKMMAVSVQMNPTFSAGTPRVLFEGVYVTSTTLPGVSHYHDIHPDGQSFLMIKPDQGPGQINVVLNWFEELKRLVPID